MLAPDGAHPAGGRPIEKILLVEDNEINLEIMQSQLLSAGYQVETAPNGKEALAKWEKGDYDVVLTDLEMPEMDGYALVAEIRKNSMGGSKTPIILAITASDFDLTEERARDLGFDGYLLKPLDLDALKRKLAGIPLSDNN
ncbi:MAG: response regulator [Deltaproteobacteria bacterium]|nr:response regulator [Deltaproteobacteria bacterium]